MILIGQYDSPFVRRVGIALTLYGIAFEHRPWSTFGDADRIRPCNPLTRVPTLVLDDGDVLTDSHIILDHVDRLVPEEQRLAPVTEPARRRVLRVVALAMGMAEKAVSLFYELRLHAQASDFWVARCRAQIGGVLTLLEPERAAAGEYWFGDRIGHADIAVAVALRFLNEAHPGLVDMGTYPALAGHAARMEEMELFREVSQEFIAPA